MKDWEAKVFQQSNLFCNIEINKRHWVALSISEQRLLPIYFLFNLQRTHSTWMSKLLFHNMHLWDSKRAGIHIRDFWSFWMEQSIWVFTCVTCVVVVDWCLNKRLNSQYSGWCIFFMTIPWRKALKIGYKHLLKPRLDHWSTVIIVLLRCVHPADPGSKVMIKSNI